MDCQLECLDFDEIIDCCHKLLGNEKLTVFNFGRNKDLTLYFYKDEDYNPEVDEEYSDLVFIVTKKNGVAVDDTENTYVTDGSLYKELNRIYNYQDLKTL